MVMMHNTKNLRLKRRKAKTTFVVLLLCLPSLGLFILYKEGEASFQRVKQAVGYCHVVCDFEDVAVLPATQCTCGGSMILNPGPRHALFSNALNICLLVLFWKSIYGVTEYDWCSQNDSK